MKDYKIAKITWQDAETYGDSAWIAIEEGIDQASTPPPCMSSVGWVLHQDDHYVAITSDLGPNECGHITKIPLQMVRTMEILD